MAAPAGLASPVDSILTVLTPFTPLNARAPIFDTPPGITRVPAEAPPGEVPPPERVTPSNAEAPIVSRLPGRARLLKRPPAKALSPMDFSVEPLPKSITGALLEFPAEPA